MKRIFALMLVGIVYLSSCTKDNSNDNLLAEPQMDSVSKGSFFQITFRDPSTSVDTESFLINDLIYKNQAVYTLYSNVVRAPLDSTYTAKIQITDHKAQKIAVNLDLFDSSTTLGDFKVFNSQSTFTDYSKGRNTTYSILRNSVVTITHSAEDCVTGSFTLNLYYNHDTIPAYGSFKIFH